MDNNELYHYGVLGMKWGVRKSRPSSSGSSKRKKKTNELSPDLEVKTKRKSDLKSRRILSDDELKGRSKDLS